jgi:protein O-mannosyl-transferase
MREGPRHPYLLVGWAWFVGTLIPTIGLVQVGDQARADRYTYVPAIGLFMIVVWGLSELTLSWRFARMTRAILATVALTACAAVSLRQVGYWRNNISLFTRAIAVTSGNYRAEALLGVALSVKGRYEEAIRHYNASLKILPGNAETHSNLGSALVDLGRKEDALHEFAEAVRFKPGSPIFHYNLAVMLNDKGRTREAIDELRTSVRLDPGNPEYGKALDLLVEYAKRH